MPTVGIAEVLVKPIFSNSQRTIAREFGPAAERAGRDAGSRMGRGLTTGLAAETAGFEAEAELLSQKVSQAEERVAASRQKLTRASQEEEKALGSLRVAELKLAEARGNGNTKASQLAAAEERVTTARNKAEQVTKSRETAETNLSAATDRHTRAQRDSSTAATELETHLRRVTEETDRTSSGFGRLSASLSRAWRGRPLGQVADSIRGDTKRINLDMHDMARTVSQQGTRGGRAFTQAFLGVSVALAGIIPAVGGAGAALLGGVGNVLTLAASLLQLSSVAALIPAGLMAVGAGVGVMVAAFRGVGDALKAITDETDALGSGPDPRLAAMAIEDAQAAIVQAEESAADSRVDAARRVEDATRRVEDARRSLADAEEAAAEATKAATKAVEMARRSEADAARDVADAQRDLTAARDEAAARVKEVAREAEAAERKAVDTALAYRKAVAAYDDARSDPKSSDDKLLQLSNAVAKAKAADEDAKTAVIELKDEHARATEEAKSGSEAVAAAEQRLADARQSQLDAIQDRKDAEADVIKVQKDGARQVADAQQAVADAQRAVADASQAAEKAQVASARAVEQAHRNLARVQMQQADTAAQAGEKSSQAMDKLTPAAQTAVRALLAVYDQLGAIRRIAQENFFTGFTGPLLALSDRVMPQLAVGVGAIATALGTGAQMFMTSLGDALGNGVLQSLLLGVADSITVMNGAIDPLVQAFITLGTVGMDYMPLLSGAVVDMAEQFNTFIQDAAASGELKEWIDDGIQGLKDLASIIGSVSGIFAALTAAAASGGAVATLGGLADGLNRVQTIMEGPVFQDTMSTLFAGAEAGSQGLLAAIGPIGEAFRVGADNLAEFLRLGGEISGAFVGGIFTAMSNPDFGAGLTTFMEGLQRGVDKVVPLLPGLTGSLGELLTNLAPLAETLGPTMVEVFTGFADILSTVVGWLDPLLLMLADSPIILGLLIGAFVATSGAAAGLTLAGNIQRIAMAGWAVASGVVKVALLILRGQWISTAAGAVVAGAQMAGVWARQTAAAIGSAASHVAAAARVVGGWVLMGLQSMLAGAKIAAAWVLAMGPIGWVTAIVIGIVALIVANWDEIKAATAKLPEAFDLAMKGIGKAWNALGDIAKKPVKFVVDTVIRGLVETFNKIPGVDIPVPKLPKGFRKGGYTGDIPEDEEAGVVHGREFVMNAAATRAIGKTRLARMAHEATHGGGAAATAGGGNMDGFFTGNRAAIARNGAYYLDVAPSLAKWNFPGAAAMWDGMAGVKVAIGRGQTQGYARPLERGGGILGYATNNNIDMSPSWMNTLNATQRRTVAAHEMGHAMGLPHNSGHSIMQPNLGQMASGPTAQDIANMQYLYPGGSGRAGIGSGAPVEENPFSGLVDKLMKKFKDHFPEGGMIIDAVGGLAKSGIDSLTKLIQDIKDGIKNIAGNVFDSVKNFFGGGAATAPAGVTPNLYDSGGVLPPGMSQVLNQTGKPEAILTNHQWAVMRDLSTRRAGDPGTRLVIEGNVYGDPMEIVDVLDTKQRRNTSLNNLRRVVNV